MDLVKLVSPTGVVVKVSGDRVEKYLKVGYKADKPKKSRARKKPAGNEDE